jgi:predicted AAA+ superfamily ATPase
MLKISRKVRLDQLTKKKSHILFGPRQTGKSFLIREQLTTPYKFNLLDLKIFNELSVNPALIRERCTDNSHLIVIDEIQKYPELLDEVQLLIEEGQFRFLLTGSSARKLRRGGINLLGGRARIQYLHPLTYEELGDKFQLDRALYNGLLPSIYFSDCVDEDLSTYIGTYLTQEIAAEGLTRNIPAFSRFLEAASVSHTKLLNYSKISADAQVLRSTVQNYFQILYDTLIGYELKPWSRSRTRKSRGPSKFFLFDNGVARKLQGRGKLSPLTPEYGEAFESFIFHEIKAYMDYADKDAALAFWYLDGEEVDFILNDEVAIEVKSSATANRRLTAGLYALKQKRIFKRHILVDREAERRTIDGIEVMPYQTFLRELWAGDV